MSQASMLIRAHPSRAKKIMFQGTSSGVGKSLVTAAFCRHFAGLGLRTTPFKSQNMALNSFVTDQGEEIAYAQVVQAAAARTRPLVSMNPLLLKPKGNRISQVILNGRPVGDMSAVEYHTKFKQETVKHIEGAFNALAQGHDVVVIEGAGSPAETNLKQYDLSNMAVAEMTDAPVYLVADIDRGGVIASITGTVSLLSPLEKARVKGIIINKFRGDRTLLQPALDEISSLTGISVVGVIPYLNDLVLPEEDSQHLGRSSGSSGLKLNVLVVALPRMSNFTDFDELRKDPHVDLRFINGPTEVMDADLLILPGTKNTIGDLEWLEATGLRDAIVKHIGRGGAVVGICGGFQMLGERLLDPAGIESGVAGTEVPGLGALPIETVFKQEKETLSTVVMVGACTAQSCGLLDGCREQEIAGYLIRHGRSRIIGSDDGRDGQTDRTSEVFVLAGGGEDGVLLMNNGSGSVIGTYFHGIFSNGEIRRSVTRNLFSTKLDQIYGDEREEQPVQDETSTTAGPADNFDILCSLLDDELDRLAQTVTEGLDMGQIYKDMGLKI